jgi:AraC-like DNA-binding protein
MLRNTNTAIPYISAESGFESESSFYRIFKEQTGISPNHFRLSPASSAVPVGVQGYAPYRRMDAVEILKSYADAG